MILIYEIINNLNNKKYIGQRLSDHFNNYYGSGVLIRKAIKKYGKDNFTRKILDYALTPDEADQKETLYIQEKNSLIPYGYNICEFGHSQNGVKHSNKTRQKLSKINFGKKLSEETKKKIGKTQKGKKLSEEHKRKISEALKGNNHPMFGKHLSKEHKEKMSLSNKGENNPFYGKNILKNHY